MRTMLGLLVVAMLLGTFVPLTALAAAPVVQPFPLAKGAYWVYSGPTKWTPEGSDQVQEKALTWRMEITDVIQRDGVVGALVKGHPMDLSFYEEDRVPGDYLIVGVADQKYYLLSGDRVQEALKQLKDPEDPLTDLVRDTELFLELPMVQGTIFGETFQITRTDHLYYWIVTDEQKADLSKVEGIPASSQMTEYELTFTTLSDNQTVGFVPGVGITRYAYRHNGTVSEFDLRLIEFNAGTAASK